MTRSPDVRFHVGLGRLVDDAVDDGLAKDAVALALRVEADRLDPPPDPVATAALPEPTPGEVWNFDSKYLRRDEAAAYIRKKGLRMARATLAKFAVVGGGPPFRRYGRWPVYSPADLDAWIEARLTRKVASTSAFSEGAA